MRYFPIIQESRLGRLKPDLITTFITICCRYLQFTADEPKKKKHRTKKNKSAKKRSDSSQKEAEGEAGATSQRTENESGEMEVYESDAGDNDGDQE